MNSRQLGTIRFSDISIREYPNNAAAVLGILKFVPVHVESLLADMVIKMTGISEKFDITPEHCVPPEYDIDVVVNEKGELLDVTCVKKQQKKKEDNHG